MNFDLVKILSADVTPFSNVNIMEKMVFTRHLGLMLKSGISFGEALEISETQAKSSRLKKIISSLRAHVANGLPLHTGLQKFPKVFDPFYIQMIKVGEESGSLEQNLTYLAIQLKKNYDFNSKVRQALMYPGLVLSLAVSVGFGISVFALPKLVDLFDAMDVTLPLSTKLLISFSRIMGSYGIWIGVIFVVLVILAQAALSTKLLRPYWDKFMLSIPRLGYVLQSVELASLFRNLGTMLMAGIPISSALITQKESTKNTVYKGYLGMILDGVQKGKTIEAELLEQRAVFMPLIAVRMISVGEKTGKLAETCSYLGDFFETEVDQSAKDFTTLLEPLIIVAVGLIVAFISLAIITPIYQFTGSIGR